MGREQSERRRFDILRRYLVGDVDDLRVRVRSQDHALNGSDKVVCRPEVGDERYEWIGTLT